jgi:hypothetical protein
MPEHPLRFGVVGQPGYRAETWKCLTDHGAGKRLEVYVVCRGLGNALKLSLHASGRWHVAFDSQQFSRMFEDANVPPDRFMGKWDKPAPLTPLSAGLTRACRIHIPWDAANIPDPSPDIKVHWIPCAPLGQSVEVAVFLTERPLDNSDWPGRASMQTKPVGQFPLEGGGSISIVHRTCPTIEQAFPPMSAPGYFKGNGKEQLLARANRALRWGAMDDGSIIFQERPVVIAKKKEAS